MTTPVQAAKTTPEASQSPNPSPSNRVTTDPFRVLPTPSMSTGTEPDPSAAGATAADPQGPADPLAGNTPSASDGDYGHGPDAAPLKLRKKPLGDVIKGLVMGTGKVLHSRLAVLDDEVNAGLWLIDEPQANGIADPLASIASRHAGGQIVNPDVGDLIAAGVAAAGYIIANAMTSFELRRQHRRNLRTEDIEGDQS